MRGRWSHLRVPCRAIVRTSPMGVTAVRVSLAHGWRLKIAANKPLSLGKRTEARFPNHLVWQIDPTNGHYL